MSHLGEWLFDTKIILCPEKKQFLSMKKIKDNLINVALVYFDFVREHYIKSSIVRCERDNEILYIAEGNLNAIWRYIRRSVGLGKSI